MNSDCFENEHKTNREKKFLFKGRVFQVAIKSSQYANNQLFYGFIQGIQNG